MTRALMLAAALAATACHSVTVVRPGTVAGQEHAVWNDYFLFGLVGENEVDVRDHCAEDPASVQTGGNFLTGLVSVVTLGIYTPRKVWVTCVAGDFRKEAAR